MTKSFLSKLAYRRDSDIATTDLVPRLHTITVDYVPSYFDMLDFVDAIHSRMMLGGEGRPESADIPVTRLKAVEIRHIRGILEPNDTVEIASAEGYGVGYKGSVRTKNLL